MIPERNKGLCEGCGDVIDVTADGHAEYVSGWSVNRYKGTNGVVAQQRHRRWICRICVDKRKAGIPDEQTSMF